MKKLIIVIAIAVFIGIFLIPKNSSTPLPNKSPLIAQSVDFNEITTVAPTAITTYIQNPGIGWQEAHTFSSPLLPETVGYRRPQYSWKLENPSDGVTSFANIDSDIASYTGSGKQFSFRIYSANADPQLPDWVIGKGAKIIGNNPDYSNCVYQEEWGKFVNAMRAHFDGNTNIAFIDISGYGNYNEWGWTDGQTVFDGDANNPGSIDGQGRKRLADAFIGGSGNIKCKNADGSEQSVSYSYPGFQRTQLVMPFAGITESSKYVYGRRSDVGFRNDCLGRANTQGLIESKLGGILSSLWTRAPVIYEYCGNVNTTPDLLARASSLLKLTHGSITHDNFSGSRDKSALLNLLNYVGYRYLIKKASWNKNVVTGGSIDLKATWENIGNAVNYPKMGQSFTLHYYLTQGDKVISDIVAKDNIHAWTPGDHEVTTKINTPEDLKEGTYQLKTAIIEVRSGKSINLSFDGRDALGHYLLGDINIINAIAATPTITPTPTATTISLVSTNPPSATATSIAMATLTPNPTTAPKIIAYVSISPTPRVLGIAAPVSKISILPQTGISDNINIAILAISSIGVLLFSGFRLK